MRRLLTTLLRLRVNAAIRAPRAARIRLIRSTVAFAIATGTCSAFAQSVPIFDQKYVPVSTVTFQSFDAMAQTFTVGFAGSLVAADLLIRKGPDRDDLLFSVTRTDASGAPDLSDVLFSTIISNGTLAPLSFEFIRVPTTPIPVSAGDRLALVIEDDVDTDNSGIQWAGDNPGSYPGGSFFFVASETAGDSGFRTLMLAADPPVVRIDNGMSNTIDDAALAGSSVIVDDAPDGSSTMVTVLPGGEIGTQLPPTAALTGVGHSEIVIEGGSTGSIVATDHAAFLVKGGNIRASSIRGEATLSFSGATHPGGMSLDQSAFAEISGGSIGFLNVGGGGTPGIGASFEISGGSVGGLVAQAIQFNGFGTGVISGGILKGDLRLGGVYITGPRLTFSGGVLEGGLEIWEGFVVWTGGSIVGPGHHSPNDLTVVRGELVIHGRNFNYPAGPIDVSQGTLTGVLADGSPIDNTFVRALQDSRIVLSPVVDIDIRPGDATNAFDPTSRVPVPVAVLGSTEFDASDIDPTTLGFGPDRGAALEWDRTDVNDDGIEDFLSLHLPTESEIAFGDDEACLVGTTHGGVPFRGCDAIRTGGRCGIGFELVIALLPLAWLRQSRRAVMHRRIA